MIFQISKNELEIVNARFNEVLQTLTFENADSKVLMLGNPPKKLRSSGIKDKPLKLYGNKLVKKAKKHNFVFSDIKNLPKAIAAPIAVFKGSHDDSFVILTKLEIKGNKVVVSIETNKKGEVDINLISSVYGKSNDGIVDWINKEKLLYANKEKALDYLSAPALITGATNNQKLNSATKVVKNFKNPTIEDKKV